MQWLLLGFSLLLLLLALQHAFRQITELNRRDVINTAAQLSNQHQRMEAFLEAMRGQAEERLRSNPSQCSRASSIRRFKSMGSTASTWIASPSICRPPSSAT